MVAQGVTPTEEGIAEQARLANNLANRLSDLGRPEEALEQAKEAVRIRRQLAEARPDAFLSDLAQSVAVLGDCRAALDGHSDAAANHHESLTILAPFLQRFPARYRDLAGLVARLYQACLKKAGQEPDIDLLVRINAILQPGEPQLSLSIRNNSRNPRWNCFEPTGR